MIMYFCVTCSTWHLLALNCFLHLRDHEYIVCQGLFAVIHNNLLAPDFMVEEYSASSANNLIVPDMSLLVSFI